MNCQRWTLMNKKSSKTDEQLTVLQRLLQSDRDDESIPVNRSRLVRIVSEDSNIDDESENEDEAECNSGEDENDLLLQLLLKKHKQSLRKSGKLKRPSAFARRRRGYDDLREKLNDIRDQQGEIQNFGYSRNREASRRTEQNFNNRFIKLKATNSNKFTEQRSQRYSNEERETNRYFEKRGNRRFVDQRGRQRRFNEQRVGRNRFSDQGRKQRSSPEQNNNAYTCEEVVQNDKDENEGTDKIGQDYEQSENKVKENQENVDEEMEALMGFTGFQSTKLTPD